jgi:hypothetical protein
MLATAPSPPHTCCRVGLRGEQAGHPHLAPPVQPTFPVTSRLYLVLRPSRGMSGYMASFESRIWGRAEEGQGRPSPTEGDPGVPVTGTSPLGARASHSQACRGAEAVVPSLPDSTVLAGGTQTCPSPSLGGRSGTCHPATPSQHRIFRSAGSRGHPARAGHTVPGSQQPCNLPIWHRVRLGGGGRRRGREVGEGGGGRERGKEREREKSEGGTERGREGERAIQQEQMDDRQNPWPSLPGLAGAFLLIKARPARPRPRRDLSG